MKEIRCKKCSRKLGMVEGKAEIKCARCGTVNTINTQTHKEVS